MVFRTDLAHFLYSRSTILHTLQFGPDFTVQPFPVLWYKVSPHQKLVLSDVQKCLEHNYFLESKSQIWICPAVVIGAEKQSFVSPQS